MDVVKRAAAAATCALAVAAGTVAVASPAEAATVRIITGWNQGDCTFYAKQYVDRMLANGTYRSAFREPCVKKAPSTWQSRITFYS